MTAVKMKQTKKRILILTIIVIIILATAILIKQKRNADTWEVLIVGDSIGEGAGSSDPAMKWYKYLVPYMKETYGINLEITNVSMGGNTSYAGYARVMELKSTEQYDLAIICYGENDQPEDFALYYESILHAINSKYPNCRLMTILESSQRDYTDKIKTIQSLSDHYGAYVADTIAAFTNSGRPYDELCDDGTHPNDEGQKVYYETVKILMDELVMLENNSNAIAVNPVDSRVEDFQKFKYYSINKFKKVKDRLYELEIQTPLAMLGIDYSAVKGENDITIITDEQTEYTKTIGWNNDFSLQFIELLAENCKINSKIQIQFSSDEQAEAFHGIIINEY